MNVVRTQSNYKGVCSNAQYLANHTKPSTLHFDVVHNIRLHPNTCDLIHSPWDYVLLFVTSSKNRATRTSTIALEYCPYADFSLDYETWSRHLVLLFCCKLCRQFLVLYICTKSAAAAGGLYML